MIVNTEYEPISPGDTGEALGPSGENDETSPREEEARAPVPHGTQPDQVDGAASTAEG